MRWLHVADFHFEEDNAKQNLFEDEIVNLDKPDFIVVTGDLHNHLRKKGQTELYASSYEQTAAFLNKLMDHWNLTSDDIFIVPGNHDVDAVVQFDEFKDLNTKKSPLRRKINCYSGGHRSTFQYNNRHLSYRFSQYSEFIKDLLQATPEATRDSAGVFIRTWREKINLLHVNTALFSTKNNSDEYQGMDTYALSKLTLSDTQKELPTLLLGHHGFFRLHPKQLNDVKTALDKLNVVAYLCGDKHKSDENKILTTASREIQCITTAIGAADTTYWSEMGVIEYEWETTRSQANVVLHIWDLDKNKWSHTDILNPINMHASARASYLQREIREQVEHLDQILLPRIEDEKDRIIYPNPLTGTGIPLEKLLSAKEGQESRYFYLFEGTRTTRGGTGKTSSLLSVFKAKELNKKFYPIYIQLRNLCKSSDDTLARRIEQQAKHNNNFIFLLLLDGFDEISSDEQRQRCISEILSWSDSRHEADVIIITGRDPLEIYFRMANIHLLDPDDIDRFLHIFGRYKVMQLSPEQQREYLGESLPNESDMIWDILDNPFFVSRFRESTYIQENLGHSAKRWEYPSFSECYISNKRNRTSLMLGSLLYEVNRLGAQSGDAVERKRFLLTKLLPAIAYRKLLADKTADAGVFVDGEIILEWEYLRKAIPSQLNMYSSILQIWHEYRRKDEQRQFYSAWKGYWEKGENYIHEEIENSEYIIGPLTLDQDGNYCFSHAIYQEFFTAFHIANIVYAIVNGMQIPTDSEEAMDLAYVQVEHMDHHILLQSEEILEQYFGLPFCSKELETCNNYLSRETPPSYENMILCQILIRFLDARTDSDASSERKKKRHELFDYFRKNFLIVIKTSAQFMERYKQFYLYVVALLARDYRVGTGCSANLAECKKFVYFAIEHQIHFHIPKADGYLQMGLWLNAVMERLINNPKFRTDFISNQDIKVGKANEIFKLTKTLNYGDRTTADKAKNELEKQYSINTTPATLSGVNSYYELLQHARQAYLQSRTQPYSLKLVRTLGYISKAYLVLAALGNSGGAFNRLGLMFANQANAMEYYPKTAVYRKAYPYSRIKDIDLSSKLYSDHYVRSYEMFQIACDIKRGDQPYSNAKLVELILKGRVFVGNGLNHPAIGDGKRVWELPSSIMSLLDQAVQKAENGFAALGSYWHGRLLIIKANMDETNREFFLKQARDFFRKEEHEHGKRETIHYSEHLDEDSTLPAKIMLSTIELLDPAIRGIDPEGFDSPMEDVCEAILCFFEKQLKFMYLNSKKPKINTENYCLAPVDLLENIDRFQKTADDLLNDIMHVRLEDLKVKVGDLKNRFW